MSLLRDRIKTALLLEGLDDICQVWWIAGTVHKLTGIPRETPELVDLAVGAVRDLLDSGYAVFGDAVQDERGMVTIVPWESAPDEVAARVKKEWGELDDRLRMGDIGWLELTDKGREEARRLDAAGCDPFNE